MSFLHEILPCILGNIQPCIMDKHTFYPHHHADLRINIQIYTLGSDKNKGSSQLQHEG